MDHRLGLASVWYTLQQLLGENSVSLTHILSFSTTAGQLGHLRDRSLFMAWGGGQKLEITGGNRKFFQAWCQAKVFSHINKAIIHGDHTCFISGMLSWNRTETMEFQSETIVRKCLRIEQECSMHSNNTSLVEHVISMTIPILFFQALRTYTYS